MPLFSTWYLNFAQAGGFHILINFHEEPLGIIKLGASSREAGQDSGSTYFRHQDAKTQRLILTKGFPLCLGAFVAIYSPQPL
jgi:hypothetical protein